MGKNVHVENHFEKFHAHDTGDWVVDNTKITALGWRPKYDIYTGLRKTVKDILEGENELVKK